MTRDENTPPRGTMKPRPSTDPGVMPRSDSPLLEKLLERVNQVHEDIFAPDGRIASLERSVKKLTDATAQLTHDISESRRVLDLIHNEVTHIQSRVTSHLINKHVDTMPAPPPAEAMPNVLVLIVEDEQMLQRSLERLLSTYDIRTIAALDAEQARSIMAKGDIDIVLIDVRLNGEMGGIDLASFVQHAHPGIGIVLMSGLWLAEDVRAAEQMGIIVLHKPFSAVEIVAKLRAALAARAVEG